MTAASGATATRKSAAKKSTKRPPHKAKVRTITSATPLYVATLRDVVPAWYDGQDVDEHADALVEHLIGLGGNQ